MLRLVILLIVAMAFAWETLGQDNGQLRPGLALAAAEGRLDEVWAEARARDAIASGAEGAFVLEEPEPEPLTFPDPEKPVVLAEPVNPDLVVEPEREVVQAVTDPVFSLESFGNEAVPGEDAARTADILAPEAAALPEVLPEVLPESEPVEVAAASTETPGTVWYVKADSVNVRAEPSTEAAILGKLSTGEALLLVEAVDSEWVRIVIEGDGIEGFVASRFLSPEAP